MIAALVNWTTLIRRLKFRWPAGSPHPAGPAVPQTQVEIQEPYFRAEIVGKKQAYRRGEHVIFRSRFTGWLFHGFFANTIVVPEIIEEQGITLHRLFSNTTTNISDDGRYAKSWPKETLSTWSDQGTLHGEINTNWISWEWEIPTDCELGKYKVKMSVWNIIENRKEPFITYQDDFDVIEPKEHAGDYQRPHGKKE